MAKKKKKHPTHHRRSRMSGVGSGLGHDFMEVVGLVAGSVAATVAQRQFTTVNPKIVSGGELVGGYLIKKHARSPFMTGLGWGMISAGAIGLTHEIGLIHGVEDFVSGITDGEMGYIEEGSTVHGLSNEHTVGGLRNEAMMSGGDANEHYMDPLYAM